MVVSSGSAIVRKSAQRQLSRWEWQRYCNVKNGIFEDLTGASWFEKEYPELFAELTTD
jgi:hypothetical protein